MMEDFVTFELAKKLKEKGFREECLYCYRNKDGKLFANPLYGDATEIYITTNELLYSHNSKVASRIDAPTISQVLKWLREEKELHIEIYMYHNCYLWEIYNTKIYDADFTQKSEKYSEIEYENYEQAALAGVEYILENLI